MTNLTRQQWDNIAKRRISQMLDARVKPENAIRHANESMVIDYGPRPEKEPKAPEPPWWARLALRVTLGKEGSSMPQRILVALVYAVSAAVAAYQTGGMPSTPEQWMALVFAFLIAFWAKFSSSTTVISASRPGETQAMKPAVTL